MSTLRNHLANSASKQDDQKRNPEMDAKIDAYIAKNQRLYDHYIKKEHTYLARRIMLDHMKRSEAIARKNAGLQEVLDADPELKASFESAMARIPEEKREQSFRSVVKDALVDRALAARPNGIRISA